MTTRSPVLFRINRRIGNTEGFYSLIVPAIVYLSLAAAILYAMWPYFYHIKNETFIVLGIFASWRYGWAITHYIRAVIYEFFRYPRLRRLTHDLPPDQRYPSHIFFIIPSYREEAWVTLEAIHSLFSNLAEIEITATFIVATGSDEDDKAVYAAYKAHPYHHNVELVLQRQKQGKRIAMGHALRALARRYDGDYNSVTIFMDGDSYLPPRSLAIALPFFTRFRDLGAATTNEAAFINTRSLLYKEWFNLKFGQRHLLFKSHALSNKVLTLTGRFSMFRTAIIAQEDFIQQIENDYLDHWMHGRFRFLMGDDKSTWFYLLKHGWNMLYLHDVIAYSLESRDDSFLKISMSLPYRWYGNTLRNNLRALKLGWRRTGLFIWWCIFDQRINMWTGLVGITGATILSLSKSFIYLPFYIAWVLIVKTLQTSVIALRGHPVSLLTIPLMLYNQWIGSLIKIKASFHLADQSWSKGGQKQSSQQDHIAVPHPLAPLMPDLTMLVSVLLFLYVMLLAEGALELPRWPHARAFAAGNHVEIDLTLYGVVADDGKDDSAAIRRVLDIYADTAPLALQLPAGRIDLAQPITIRHDDIALLGAGMNKTHLVASFAGTDKAVIEVQGQRQGRRFRVLPPADGAPDVLVIEPTDRSRMAVERDDWLLLFQPNDDDFLKRIGSRAWNKPYPALRQVMVKVEKADESQITLATSHGLALDGPAFVQPLRPVRRFALSDLTIEYRIPGTAGPPDPEKFHNDYPNHRVDGIALHWVTQCRLDNVTVRSAGRHPLHLDGVSDCRFNDIRLHGAWNKGKGGNGYLRIARSHRNVFDGIELRGLRHLTLQWSSSYNSLRHIRGDTDINFHGGYSHHNRLRHLRLTLSPERPWPPIYRTPADARWAPPDGPANRVQQCLWRYREQTGWKTCDD